MTILYIYLGFGIVIIFIALILVSRLLRQIREDQSKLEWIGSRKFRLVIIRVPKNNEKTPLAAEQMFVALHGIYNQGAKFQEDFSFEIVAKNQFIQFYIYVPVHLADFVIGQIYAQYPTVEMEEVQDYTQYEMHAKNIAATEFVLEKNQSYPIKTFLNFEVDPIASITAVLSNLKEGEQIWVQTILSPIGGTWQKDAQKYINNVRGGKAQAESTGSKIAKKTSRVISEVVSQAISGPKEAEKPGEVKLNTMQEEGLKAIEQKITKQGFNTKIRVLVISQDEATSRAKIASIIGAYKQFNSASINGFTIKKIITDQAVLKIFQHRYFGEGGYVLNVEELASIYHFPNETVATPTIVWAGSKKGEPPSDLPLVTKVDPMELTVFAKTNFRNHVEKFGIKLKDRRLHMYVVGKTGTGKSTLLENMIIDDIKEGRGIAIVDPHGETVNHIIDSIPESRIKDVVYFNPADKENTIGFNLLESVDDDLKPIVASGAVGVFKKIFGDSWGPRLEYILRNTILALMDYPDATLLGVMKVLVDKNFRTKVEASIKDPVVKDFFINEYDKYDPKFRMEAISSIQNKVGQFLSTPMIRNIVGQPHSTFSVEEVMNNKKILLVDLSMGKIGEDNSALLGSMLITKIQLAAMRRAMVHEDMREDFYLYVDEFQNFATDSFAVILSEARKYHLNLIMTNQYTAQLSETVANAIFGNVGTMAVFRVGATDASAFEKEMEPVFNANDMVNLANYNVYLKMAIDGVTRPAFSAVTLPPFPDKYGLKDRIIESSRKQFTRLKSTVEDEITKWSETQALPPEPGTAGVPLPKFERFKDKEGEVWYQGLETDTKTEKTEQNKIEETFNPDSSTLDPKSSDIKLAENLSEVTNSTELNSPEPVKDILEQSAQLKSENNEKNEVVKSEPQNQPIDQSKPDQAFETKPVPVIQEQKHPQNIVEEVTPQPIPTQPKPAENQTKNDSPQKTVRQFMLSPEESMEALKGSIYHGLNDVEELEDGHTVQF